MSFEIKHNNTMCIQEPITSFKSWIINNNLFLSTYMLFFSLVPSSLLMTGNITFCVFYSVKILKNIQFSSDWYLCLYNISLSFACF